MEMKIVGIADVKFENDSGQLIEGTSLYVAYKDKRVQEGMKTDKIFVQSDIELPVLKAGDTAEVYFNNRKSIEYIEKI